MKNDDLIKLLKKAQGNRGQNQFAANAGISNSALSCYLVGTRNPSPDSLLKLANRAHNGVTYEDLMRVAGYLPGQIHKVEVKTQPLTPAQTFIIEAVTNKLNEKQLQRVLGFVQALTQDQITKEEKAN